MGVQHHTKSKGDIALGYVISELFAHGFSVCLPVSDHLPFDLVAVDETCQVSRVQIKHVKLKKNRLQLKLRSSYANKKGVFTKTVDRSMIDSYAAYCPDLNKLFFVDKASIPAKLVNSFTINPADQRWGSPNRLFGR